MCTQEKEQIKTLISKSASITDTIQLLEQQNKMLESKCSLQQQQKTARSNTDNMLESCINNLQQQLYILGQEQLKLEAELGNMEGLLEDFKNKHEDEISKCTEMDNKFVFKKFMDKAYMNNVELESCMEGLTDEINFIMQLKRSSRSCSSRSWTHLWFCLWTTATPWTQTASSLRSSTSTRLPTTAGWRLKTYRPRSSRRNCRHWLGSMRMMCCTKTKISEMNQNISWLQAETESLKGQKTSLEAAIMNAKHRGEPPLRTAMQLGAMAHIC